MSPASGSDRVESREKCPSLGKVLKFPVEVRETCTRVNGMPQGRMFPPET